MNKPNEIYKIRVAYDITFLARAFKYPDVQSGVYRAIEDLLMSLCKVKDLELAVVCLCSDRIIEDTVQGLLYLSERRTALDCQMIRTFRSRLRLEELYCKFLTSALLKQRHDASVGKRAYTKAMSALLYRLYKYGIDKVDSYVDSDAFDIFHSPFLTLPPKSKTRSTPRVINIYDLFPITHSRMFSDDIVRTLQNVIDNIDKSSDWVICNSQYVKQDIRDKLGIPTERIFVIPLAAGSGIQLIDDKDYLNAVLTKYGLSEKGYFLGVSALQPRKNLVRLIRSFRKLLSMYEGVRLALVGAKGWKYEEVFSEIEKDQSLRKKIVFTGQVSDLELSALYTGAIAFVYPSLLEGFGLPPLEAMKCGVPVIASNNTSLPEVVGDAGILVDPFDEDAIFNAMRAILESSELQQELREKGLARASMFSWQRCATETSEAYRRVITKWE